MPVGIVLFAVFTIGGMVDRDTAVFVRDNDIFASSDFDRIDRTVPAGKRSVVKNHDVAVVIHFYVLPSLNGLIS